MSAPGGGLVDTSISRAGVQGVSLGNDLLSLTVFPDAGGKILDLVHRPSGVNLLWQNPRIRLARTYAGAPFDDVWCGGWDELFPTDAACTVDGTEVHDHGDLWIGPWEWEVEDDEPEQATLYLRRYSASLPCSLERWITLRRDARCVDLRYRLTNLGPRPVAFLWNLHVAHAIEAGSRLHLPVASLAVEPPYFGRAGKGTEICAWPVHVDSARAEHDLSRTPGPDAGLAEFFWSRLLEEGWCAVTHPSRGIGLGLAFDVQVFPAVWLFADYGGWRGHHFLLTEPSTSRPGSLASNIEFGTAPVLEAGTVLETEVVATLLTEIDSDVPPDQQPEGLVRTRKAAP